MTKKYATLWGIDEHGELVVPVINLWKSKKGIMEADNLGGALKHGQKIEILEEDSEPEGWVKVYKMVIHEGKKYPQEGWVKKSLVKFT